MKIGVECPHCETLFQVDRDLVGKAMRCPNPDCREVFQVVDPAAPPLPPAAQPVSIEPPAVEPVWDATQHSLPAVPDQPLWDPTHHELPAVAVTDEPLWDATHHALPAVPDEPAHIEQVWEDVPHTNPLVLETVDVGMATEEPPTVVEEVPFDEATLEAPAPEPPAAESSFSLAPPPLPDVAVLEGEAVPPPLPTVKAPVAPLLPSAPVAPLLPSAPVAPLLPSKPKPTGPQVFDWNATAPPPLPTAQGVPVAPPVPPAPKFRDPKPTKNVADLDDLPVRPRRNSPYRALIVVALAFLVLIAGGVMITAMFLNAAGAEDRAALDAKAAYDEGRYADAGKRYGELADHYPDSKELDKYRFFARLAGVNAAVNAVTAADDPVPARTEFRKFVDEFRDNPHADPNTGEGVDVVTAGLKLMAAEAKHAAGHVAKYRTDHLHPEELEAAQAAVADGRTLLPVVEKFRGKASPALTQAVTEFDAVAADVAKEKDRLAALLPWRGVADDPTDRTLDEFDREMKKVGLATDPEVQGLASKARAKLRELVKFTADRAPALPGPPDPPAAATYAPDILDAPKPRDGGDGTTDTVFTVARGVLYVHDARTGKPLWGTPVAPAAADPRGADAPLRPNPTGDANDWLIVPSDLNGTPGITARRTRTGEAVWHQPLPAPCLGRPVKVGPHLYAALQDPNGTVLQFDAATGRQLGKVELRQPIGCPLAVLPGKAPGHAFLVVAGDARRVFLFEAGKEGDDGGRLPPACVRVLATNHPKDALRTEPVVVPTDDPAGEGKLLLCQSDGPTQMRLLAFPLPSANDLAAGSGADAAPAPLADVKLKGWAWFAPPCDGERLAVATDAGVFAAFGLNRAGGSDKAVFDLPGATPDKVQETVARAQVVTAEEDAYWVAGGGVLYRLRASVTPDKGYRIVPDPTVIPVPVGEPVARPQVRPALGLGFVTAKSARGAPHLIAFELKTGRVQWRRQLGVPAADVAVPLSDGGHLLADEAGGAYRVTVVPATADKDARVEVAPITDPQENPAAAAVFAASPDGKRAWTAVPLSEKDGSKLLARRYADGKLAHTAKVPLTAAIAGKPVLLGESLLLPLANGFVYRLGATDTELSQGPLWKGAGGADARCFLAVTGDGEFAATDGGPRLVRWKWPTGGKLGDKPSGQWTARGGVTSPAVPLTVGGKPVLAVGDATGVCLFDAATSSDEPVRRWRGAAAGPIPEGAAMKLIVVTTADGPRLVFVAGGQTVVGLDPEKDDAAWVKPTPPTPDAGEVVGLTVAKEAVWATYQSGHARGLSGRTGAVVGEATREATGGPTNVPAVVSGQTVIAAPADGTVTAPPFVPVKGS